MAQTVHLFLLAHLGRSGAGGEGANVYYRAALGHDLVGAVGYFLLCLLAAPGEETVGGAIENAHDNRGGKGEQSAFYVERVVHDIDIFGKCTN